MSELCQSRLTLADQQLATAFQATKLESVQLLAKAATGQEKLSLPVTNRCDGGRKAGKLTGDHGVRAVPLGVVLALSHAAGAGLSLVGTQGLPLPLQTVLVLQVVLHVRLEGNRQCVCMCVFFWQTRPP